MATLSTITLGCKVNQYETEYLREGFLQLGYREADSGELPDLCIINTCTVTAEGEARSRKLIRQFAKNNPQAEIIVMGCYASRAADEVAAMPGVAEVIADKRQLPEVLARRGLANVPSGISTFRQRHRALVKVQDGCAMQCSYCIIPQVRPVLQSRPADDVLAEVRRLVDNDYREIVLVGIHLGHYGLESGTAGLTLARLVRRIAELPGEFRLRISSVEATEITPELIRVVADYPGRICPHLHIPMQSGADAVLQLMRRRSSSREFVERCLAVAAALDQPALTTDAIVGFPGETEDDFAATCRVVEEIGFSKLHIFRFSPRQGTPAAEMPNPVQGRIQQRRAAELATLGRQLRQRYCKSLLGRRLQVLVEGAAADRPGVLLCTSDRYVPVEFAGAADLVWRLVDVTAVEAVEGRLRCEVRSHLPPVDG